MDYVVIITVITTGLQMCGHLCSLCHRHRYDQLTHTGHFPMVLSHLTCFVKLKRNPATFAQLGRSDCESCHSKPGADQTTETRPLAKAGPLSLCCESKCANHRTCDRTSKAELLINLIL